MIDWIATHPEMVLHTCVVGISLIGAGAITYTVWWLITDHLHSRREHDKIMAYCRRYYPTEEEAEDEVIRRII